MSAHKVLNDVADILEDREEEYDDYNDMLRTIADYWNTYLKDILYSEEVGVKVVLGPEDVAQMMALFKIARASVGYGDKTADDLKDAIGYLAMSSDIRERIYEMDEDEDEYEQPFTERVDFEQSPDWDKTEESFENLVRQYVGDGGRFVAGWKVTESEK